jgi:hypothetical protein
LREREASWTAEVRENEGKSAISDSTGH